MVYIRSNVHKNIHYVNILELDKNGYKWILAAGRWQVIEMLAPETGANRNTIKAHVKKLATDSYLVQVGKGRGARYTIK